MDPETLARALAREPDLPAVGRDGFRDNLERDALGTDRLLFAGLQVAHIDAGRTVFLVGGKDDPLAVRQPLRRFEPGEALVRQGLRLTGARRQEN